MVRTEISHNNIRIVEISHPELGLLGKLLGGGSASPWFTGREQSPLAIPCGVVHVIYALSRGPCGAVRAPRTRRHDMTDCAQQCADLAVYAQYEDFLLSPDSHTSHQV
jgi:hypothetical protein